MKNKIVTVVVAVIFIVLIGIYFFSNKKVDNTNLSEQVVSEQKNSEEIKAFPYEIGADTVLCSGDINNDQKVDMNTYAEIWGYDKIGKKKTTGYGYEVTNAVVSRELPEKFKSNDKTWQMDTDTLSQSLSENGDFTKDFYYLTVSIKCTILSERGGGFNSSALHYLYIDKDTAYDLDGTCSYLFNGQEFYFSPYYQIEDDDKDALHYRNDKEYKFSPQGTVFEYSACYIISDEMEKNKNIYLAASYGRNNGTVMKEEKEYQRYLKVNWNK